MAPDVQPTGLGIFNPIEHTAQLRKRSKGLAPMANGNEAPVSTPNARQTFRIWFRRADGAPWRHGGMQGYICGGEGGLCTVIAARPTRKRGLVGASVLHRVVRNVSFEGW